MRMICFCVFINGIINFKCIFMYNKEIICIYDNFIEFFIKFIGILVCIFCSVIYIGGVVFVCVIYIIIYVLFIIVVIEIVSIFINIFIFFVDIFIIVIRI